MNFDFGFKAKPDNKCIVHSKSAVYQLMNHEKLENNSIPLHPSKLLFTIESLNTIYIQKLYQKPTKKPSTEFLKYLQYYIAYTISSLLILLAFFSLEYNFSKIPYSVFYIHLISVFFFINFCMVSLYLMYRSSFLLFHNRKIFSALILLKIFYYIILDDRVICFIISEGCDLTGYPLTLMILLEFTMARVVLFYSYFVVFFIAFVTFFTLMLFHVFIQTYNDLAIVNEIIVIGFYLFLLTADCYRRDLRMKHIFWRGEREDKASANYKQNFFEESATLPDFDIVATCEDLQKNLKYFTKVIIYKDASKLAKDSLRQMHYIKEVIGKTPVQSEQVRLPEDLDQNDLIFIYENFMELYTLDKPELPQQFKTTSANLIFQPGTIEISGVLSNLGKTWNFDMISLSESSGRSISIVSDYFLKKWGILTELKIEESTSTSFFIKLEKVKLIQSYHEVDFSNSVHAADVMHSLLCLVLSSAIRESLESIDALSILVAGLGHDVGHPGLTSSYLQKTFHNFSMKYNDRSPLENMHCGVIFSLMGQNDSEILKNFSNHQYFRCRKLVIDMILATDLAKHFEILGKFRSRAVLMQDLNLNIEEDRNVALALALKCADVGFTAKSFALHSKWLEFCVEEFSKQGDLESSTGKAVSVYFDRKALNKGRIACNLIRNIALPMFEVYGECLDNQICKEVVIYQAEKNLEYWEKVKFN